MKLQPKYIEIHPQGKDVFESKSHDKIADCICDIIKGNMTHRKIIGLEGEWGSGKSNVIEILKDEKLNKKNNKLFYYDVWGHQEDINRRSFLEEMFDFLIYENIGSKKIWKKRQNELLAKTKTTLKTSKPSLSWSFIILAFIFFFSTLVNKICGFKYPIIVENNGLEEVNNCHLVISIISPLIPYLLGFIGFKIYQCVCKKRDKEFISFPQIFYLFKGRDIKTVLDERVIEKEATSREFKKFVNEVDKTLKNEKKNVIIIFDNFDRLPNEKIKSMWSTIHSFFAECDYNNIWVIVPFERSCINKAFDNIQDEHSGNSFINKTFEVIFRVTPPILSDWETFFESKFNEAFKFDKSYQYEFDDVKRIFDFSTKRITPRKIIAFINDLVSNILLNQDIPLKYYALYYFRKNLMNEDSLSIIDKKKNYYEELIPQEIETKDEGLKNQKDNKNDFLNELEPFFYKDYEWQKYIAAIHFNVDKEKSSFILLAEEIKEILHKGGNFEKVILHVDFYRVLGRLIHNLDHRYFHFYEKSISTIKLDSLSEKNKILMQNVWNKLLEFSIQDNFSHDYIDQYKRILKNTSDLKRKNLVEFMVMNFLTYVSGDDENKIAIMKYHGKAYFETINELVDLLKSLNSEIDIFSLLDEVEFNSENFIEFVLAAKENYIKYKVICNNEDLNEYLSENFISENIEIINTIREEYSLDEFKKNIGDQILKGSTITPDNCYYVLCSYRVLFESKPIDTFLPLQHCTRLFNVINSQNDCFKDLLATLIKYLYDGNGAINWGNYSAGSSLFANSLNKLDDETIESLATIIEHYVIYRDLIKLSVDVKKYDTIERIINVLSCKSDVKSEPDTKWVIEKFYKILKVFNEETTQDNLINNLKKYQNLFVDEIEKISNFNEVPVSFIEKMLNFDGMLKEKLLQKSIHILENESKENWNSNLETEGYLFQLAVLLKKKNVLKKIKSDELYFAFNEIIDKVLKKEIKIFTSYTLWDDFIELLDGGKLKTIYENIRDYLISHNHGEVTYEEIMFFEKGLRLYGGLVRKADDVTRKILIPCLKYEKVLEQVFIPNFKEFKTIIDKSEKHIEAFKIEFKEIIKTNKYPELKEKLLKISKDLKIDNKSILEDI